MDKYLNEKKEYKSFVAFKLNGCWQKRSLGFNKEKKSLLVLLLGFFCVCVWFFVLIIKGQSPEGISETHVVVVTTLISPVSIN